MSVQGDDRLSQRQPAPVIDKFSHGIIVVRDLDASMAALRERGFTVEPGQNYQRGGSGRNAYLRFGRAFLELLSMPNLNAARAPNTVGRAFQDLVRAGDFGLVAYGLGTPDPMAARAHFDRAGMPHYLINQSMAHADGTIYRWVVQILHDHPWRRPWPVVSRYDEIEEARMSALVPDHANGAVALTGAEIAVESLEQARDLFGRLLGLTLADDGTGATLADGFRLRFTPTGNGVLGIRDIDIGFAAGRSGPASLAALLGSLG